MVKLVWIAILIVLLDQATKILARQFLPIVNNYGASFGMLQGQRWLFILISIIVIGIILYYWKQKELALSFILGGTIGNLIDRIFFGSVTDFIHIPLFAPWFNVADVANTIGGILLVWSWLHDRTIQSKE